MSYIVQDSTCNRLASERIFFLVQHTVLLCARLEVEGLSNAQRIQLGLWLCGRESRRYQVSAQ